jgi:hypothetical protein
MTPEQWSTLLSLIAALTITLAAFGQWFRITYRGKTVLRTWIRAVLAVVVVLLVAALVLFVVAVTR